MKSVEEIINDNLNLIESMVEGGSTDKEIANKLEVSYSTFKKYKVNHSALNTLMAECKNKKNEEVEQALFKCCTGYTYEEEVITKVKEEVLAEDSATVLVQERVKVSKVKKFKGPELAAQKYWLNNKKKAKWQEDPHKVKNDKKLTELKEKEVENKCNDI